MRRRDILGVVALRRSLWADVVGTPESMAWGIDHTDPGERVRRWVASDAGQVVGWAVAGRAAWTAEPVTVIYFGVLAERRGQGIGRGLFEVADAHLARLGAKHTTTASERGDQASARFLRHRGFSHTRDDQAWSVDPREVSVAELPERLAAAEAASFGLVSVRTLLDRPRDLYLLHLALQHDLPSDVPMGQAYETWRAQEFETPIFEPDASFCVLAGDRPVALTWINLDRAGRRAGHGMTGTLREYRHRGLARLVKLASIRWLAENGVTALFTDNDTTNRDMLALNEHLGFRPLTVFSIWRRGG